MTEPTTLKLHWRNPDASLQVRQKWEKSDCPHRKAELDATSRTVFCADCGQQIDAFDFLLEIAAIEGSLLNSIRSLEYEKKKLEREIAKKKTQLIPLKTK